jgi:NADH:ubiquinone oxidoreductase subunit K
MFTFSYALSFSTITALLRMIYKKKFFLSLLISLELIFLNLVTFKFIITLTHHDFSYLRFSLFLLALAAVDARIGISIITLISRKFSECRITKLNLLKK